MIQKDVIELEYAKSSSMKEVAGTLNVSVATIHRYIHRYGITPKKQIFAWNSGKTYKDDKRVLAKTNHPRYIDGRAYPSDYRKARKEILPTKCFSCKHEATLLHHKDKNIHNNELNNLIPICLKCHTILHNKERGSYEYKFNCLWCENEKIISNNHKYKPKYCSQLCKAKHKYYSEKNYFYKKNTQPEFKDRVKYDAELSMKEKCDRCKKKKCVCK